MNVEKFSPLTAIDKTLAMAAVNDALKANGAGGGGEQTQSDQAAEVLPPEAELTADSLAMYLQGIAASSCDEIDALISDLSILREKLIAESGRIEQNIVDFATLGQSVLDNVTQIRAPDPSA